MKITPENINSMVDYCIQNKVHFVTFYYPANSMFENSKELIKFEITLKGQERGERKVTVFSLQEIRYEVASYEGSYRDNEFVIAQLENGKVFEANNYQELEDKIVHFYSADDADTFSKINNLSYTDGKQVKFQKNDELQDKINTAKKELEENDGSDLNKDYISNLM
jgi:hypothetical protein